MKAEECVFIDDLPKNVEAARKEGMKGLIFESLDQAKRELEEILSDK